MKPAWAVAECLNTHRNCSPKIPQKHRTSVTDTTVALSMTASSFTKVTKLWQIHTALMYSVTVI